MQNAVAVCVGPCHETTSAVLEAAKDEVKRSVFRLRVLCCAESWLNLWAFLADVS